MESLFSLVKSKFIEVSEESRRSVAAVKAVLSPSARPTVSEADCLLESQYQEQLDDVAL